MTHWDNVAFDPHTVALAQGRHHGRRAGRAAGFRQGYATGRTTALEYSVELGFMRSFVTTYQQCSSGCCFVDIRDDDKKDDNDQDHHHRRRLQQQSMQQLMTALDAFPTPAQVFRNVHDNNNNDCNAKGDVDQEENPNVKKDDGKDPVTDVAAQMQRIRARFKLLLVQWGMPHVSLEQLFVTNHDSPPPRVGVVVNDDTTAPIPQPPPDRARRPRSAGIQKQPETTEW